MKPYDNEISTTKSISIGKLLRRALKYWYFIAIFFIITLVGVILHQKMTPSEYRISSKILISGSSEGRTTITGEEGPSIPGINLGMQSNFENQIVILTSIRQIEKILKQLDFNISYFHKDFFQTNEIYKKSPFEVIPDTSKIKLPNLDFSVRFISKDQFELTVINTDKIEYTNTHKFFEKIEHPDFSFTLIPNEKNISQQYGYVNNEFLFKIRTTKSLASFYQGKIQFERVSQGSSIVDVSIIENNIDKGVDFLNKLSQNAVNYTLQKKNQIATKTIDFIEGQLVGVMDSLSAAENVLQGFRSRNEVMDVSYQGQMIINKSSELENQKAQIESRIDYLTYLLDNIENNNSIQDIASPSAMGVENPVLNQLISDLTALNAEKSSLQFNTSADNPNINRINHRIQALINSIVETTKNIIETSKLSLNDVNNRLYELSKQIRRLPQTEQTLLNIERRFRMNNEMYTFLLERRAEAQLAKASNTPDNEIVEEAMPRKKVTPDKTRSTLSLFVFGILFPSVLIFLKVFNNNKIQEEDDIKLLSDHPVIGVIPFSKGIHKHAIIEPHSHSQLAEAFRNIRTAISYYAIDKTQQTILLTSSIPEEGKTFCSANLAMAFSQLGITTLLLGFDLRMPNITNKMFPSLNEKGLIHFLKGEKEWEKIIQTAENGTLSIITSGGIPPNPAELISSKKTEMLFHELKKHFEIIIIDSPPVGLVSDAFLLSRYSDLTLMVARQDLTPRKLFQKNIDDEKINNIEHMGIILNGVQSDKNKYSYYYDAKHTMPREKQKKG
jgi:tyrosine-protein kinase Etk/Wzc